MKTVGSLLSALVILQLLACNPASKLTRQPGSISGLKLINEYTVPNGFQFNGTTVGGLSGIDYDSKNDQYYLICDDRSVTNAARYYTAKVVINNSHLDSVHFLAMTPLRNAQGDTYAPRTVDPEAMRYNAATGQLVWSSEGDRVVTPGKEFIQDPSITLMTMDGRRIDSFELAPNMHMQRTDAGPRQNGVFEGMTFANRYRELFVSVEEPIYEDGPRAASGDSSAWIRVLHFNTRTRRQNAQYAYRVEPVARPSIPPGGYKINGIPDILWAGDNQMLVMERSFSTGTAACTIRIYLANLAGATNIATIPSLVQDKSFQPISKKLLLNLDDLGIYIDNVEGMTFGPTLANGHRSLICVADDNFSKDEQMQFFLFEVLP